MSIQSAFSEAFLSSVNESVLSTLTQSNLSALSRSTLLEYSRYILAIKEDVKEYRDYRESKAQIQDIDEDDDESYFEKSIFVPNVKIIEEIESFIREFNTLYPRDSEVDYIKFYVDLYKRNHSVDIESPYNKIIEEIIFCVILYYHLSVLDLGSPYLEATDMLRYFPKIYENQRHKTKGYLSFSMELYPCFNDAIKKILEDNLDGRRYVPDTFNQYSQVVQDLELFKQMMSVDKMYFDLPNYVREMCETYLRLYGEK